VLEAQEITGVGKEDPKRMTTMIDEVIRHLKPNDIICIEGFGFASQQAIQLGGIGWGIRMAMWRKLIPYFEPSPSQVKKFATGKGNTKKDNMTVPIYRLWGFEHKSDNVRDAFVLAQIARSLHAYDPNQLWASSDLYAYQLEVLQAIKGK
jgi:crossover junction endodeoxyribonuclease RuvC